MSTRKEDSFERTKALIKAAEKRVNEMLDQRGGNLSREVVYEEVCECLGITDKREEIIVSVEVFKNMLILDWWKINEYVGSGTQLINPDEEQIKELLANYRTDWKSGRDLCFALEWTRKKNRQPEAKKRTMNVSYTYAKCFNNETSVDIVDGSFDQMVNEMLSLVYQITDESGERDIRITNVEEVPYDG